MKKEPYLVTDVSREMFMRWLSSLGLVEDMIGVVLGRIFAGEFVEIDRTTSTSDIPLLNPDELEDLQRAKEALVISLIRIRGEAKANLIPEAPMLIVVQAGMQEIIAAGFPSSIAY